MQLLKNLLALVLLPLAWIKKRIIQSLLNLRAKLQISSLREAISDADKDKARTGRKNMVVFNLTSGKYEPVQKKLLKQASQLGKNKSNKAMTDGRRRVLKKQKRKERVFDADRIRTIEDKSLYVTK